MVYILGACHILGVCHYTQRMPEVKSRRELYSAATRAALLDEATALFAERGYAGTSLEDVASASQVTRGAVYHHFASKQALFEAVLDLQEARVTAEVIAAASTADPWDAAMLALDTYLTHCCDPVYGRLVWLEGPAALGWHRWRECEKDYAYGLVERFIRDLADGGYLRDTAFDSLVRFSFWMLGGAGLAVAEAPPEDKPRVRDEWRYLIGQAISSLRIK
jgi:AcrR family transcriptional regulator